MLLSDSGLSIASRKGIAQSCWLFSTVNLMAESILLKCSRKLCLCSSCWMAKVSSTYLRQSMGVLADLSVVLSKCSMCMLATMGLTGNPIAAPLPVHRAWLESKNKYCVGRTVIIVLYSVLTIWFYCEVKYPTQVVPV